MLSRTSKIKQSAKLQSRNLVFKMANMFLAEEKILKLIILSSTASVATVSETKKPKRQKRVCMKNFLRETNINGAHNNTLQDLRMKDTVYYRRYIKMSGELFEAIRIKNCNANVKVVCFMSH